MPNWCDNTIYVSGNAADISAFKQFVGDGKGLLNKIDPTPQELIDTVSGFIGDPDEQKKLEEQQKSNIQKYGHKDWYDWNLAHWSTKWDVDANLDDFNQTDTEVIFSFQSAWAPPQNAIAKLSEKFKGLKFRHTYMEEGMCYVGSDEYADGEPDNSFYNEDGQSEEWMNFARDEFGWEPWPDEETEEVEEAPKPAKKKVKKTAKKPSSKKKPTKKVAKKKKASKKK